MKLNQWIGMDDLESYSIPSASWIPLRAQRKWQEGQYWRAGFVEEYFWAVAIRFPIDARDEALGLSWSAIGRDNDRPWVDGENYYVAGSFPGDGGDLSGNFPVLVQHREADRGIDWHLDQDVVLGLNLKREADTWVRPEEDFIEVVRQRFEGDNRPRLVEIRKEHLRDYLCARRSGLLVATYRSRRTVLSERPELNWESDNTSREIENGHWQGFIREINENGDPYGSSVRVLTTSLDDPKMQDDVPVLDFENEENVRSESRTIQFEGIRQYYLSGEIWRNEWIDPADTSPRVRGDRIDPEIAFVIENDGTKAAPAQFASDIRWLWFSPKIALDILRRRGGQLSWFTENTGGIGLASHAVIHFGINEIGLVNIFARDIGDLPDHAQRLWASHNVTPDGGVSAELLASQMDARPASTIAPEEELKQSLIELKEQSIARFGRPLLRSGSSASDLSESIHRFQCVERGGDLLLCKEITRLITERIDTQLLKKLRPEEDEGLGSLKRLERLMSEVGADGRAIMGPLAGAYDLRIADAHAPPSDLGDAFQLLAVTQQMDDIQKGKQIIRSIADCIGEVAAVVAKYQPSAT